MTSEIESATKMAIKKMKKEAIEDIAAELRLGFDGQNVAMYFRELANRIEAAHAEGVLKAIEDLMHGKA